MYNRYIPQPDGTYRRNRMPDMGNSPQRPVPPPQPVCEVPEPKPDPAPACSDCPHVPQPRRTRHQNPPKRNPPQEPVSFWKQLLPKDFQTEDLIVVLLLLLMAGDCQEDQNTALLTLALYLFL